MSREALQIPRAGEVQRRKWMWAGVTSLPVSHCTLFSVLVAKQQNASRPLAEANNQNLITKAIWWLVLTLSHLESSMREFRSTWWPWCCPSWFCKGLPGWAAPWDVFAGRSLWREGGDTLTFPSTGMTVNPKVQDCATNCGGWLQHHRSCGGLWDWQEICNQEDSLPFHRRPKCCFAGGSQCILLLCFQTQVPYFFPLFCLEKLHQFPQEVRVTRKLSHPNIVKVVGASTRGQADILHNLTSEVLIVFPLYQVVHDFCPFAALLCWILEESPRRTRVPWEKWKPFPRPSPTLTLSSNMSGIP